MELEKEIQESIKKNLPQQVGEVLKGRLEQADKDSAEVKRLDELVGQYASDKAALEKRIEEYEKFDERNANLNSREKELETERNNLELEKLKYQLQSEKDKTAFSQNVALGLVRNTEYRKNIFDSETSGQPFLDGNGYTVYPVPTNKNHISTETIE